MENKLVTAVGWLVEQLPIRIVNSHQSEIIKSLEMGKQQIINAYKQGQYDSEPIRETDAEQYYEQTFNK